MGAGPLEGTPLEEVMPGELMDVGLVAAVVMGLLLLELLVLVLVELCCASFVAPKWALVAAVVGAVVAHHQMKLKENLKI